MANFIAKSLRNKLLILFLLVSLVPIQFVCYMNYLLGKKAIQEQTLNNLTAVADSREHAIIFYLRGKMGRVLDFSADHFICDTVEKINQKGPDVGQLSEELNKHLSGHEVLLDPEIYEVFILDHEGKVIGSSDKLILGTDRASDDYFINGKKGIYIKDIYLYKPMGTYEFAVSGPVRSRTTGKLTGVIVTNYKLAILNEITSSREGLGETGEVYIVNKDGYMITESRFTKDAVLKQKVDTEPVKLFHSRRKIMVGVYPDYRGEPIVGASEGEEIDAEFGLGWTILAEIDRREIFAPIRDLAWIMLITTAIVSLLAILVSYLFSHRVVRPILSLSSASKKVASGDLSVKVHYEGQDEIGQLAASFNQMTSEIQKRDEGLQAANEELRVSNEELQSTTEELEASKEDLTKAQEELIRKEKLAAVGQLASGVGHELRNPLGVIKNAAYYIKTKVGTKDPKLAKHLNIMEREINNSNKIISDLLGFSRTRPPAISPQDIDKIVQDTLEVVEIPKNVKLIKELGGNLPKAMTDPDQARQVFVNLALNAVQAMDNGGELKIVTRRKDGFIEIGFSDTGCGIPEENLKKLFDPFFTTKARGIGLGLAVTQGIIERHKGTIEVKSEVGKGTTFMVKLPVEKKEA